MDDSALYQVISAIIFAFKEDEYFSNVHQVVNAINQIRQSYSIKQINTINASLINYNQGCYQLAYIYIYLMSHVNIIHELLNEFWESQSANKKFFLKNRISICSLGGGPGSEIIGLSLFLKEKIQTCSISGEVFDRYIKWHTTFERLHNALLARGLKNIGNVSYQEFDFFKDTNDVKVKKSIANAKIVTIFKFISAVGFERNLAERLLTNLLLNVQPGTIVLFVDNDGGGYFELMRKSANAARLSLKHEVVRRSYEVTESVWTEFLETDLPRNFPQRVSPQKSARISGSIWYKAELSSARNNYIPRNDHQQQHSNIPPIYPTYHSNYSTTTAYPNRGININAMSNQSYSALSSNTTRYNSVVNTNAMPNQSYSAVSSNTTHYNSGVNTNAMSNQSYSALSSNTTRYNSGVNTNAMPNQSYSAVSSNTTHYNSGVNTNAMSNQSYSALSSNTTRYNSGVNTNAMPNQSYSAVRSNTTRYSGVNANAMSNQSYSAICNNTVRPNYEATRKIHDKAISKTRDSRRKRVPATGSRYVQNDNEHSTNDLCCCCIQ